MDPKHPIPVQMKDFNSFARLALALTDSPPPLWHFKHNGKRYLGTFSVYMSWKGDIPLFTYIVLKEKAGAFLAYKSDMEKEECKFSSNLEDPRYVYAPIISMKDPPKIFRNALDKKSPSFIKPLGTELDSLHSIMRLLYLISYKEPTAFPVWRFIKEGEQILGICIPFEHYYDANALPVFFYVKKRPRRSEPFLKYSTSELEGEILGYSQNTSDTKFFYAKIIDVDDMPLFPYTK